MALYAFPTRLGVFPDHTSSQPVTLKLTENVMSLSGDSFTINQVDPQNPSATRPYLKCEGKLATIHARKIITDPNMGKELFHIKKELLTIHSKWDVVTPAEEMLALVRSHFTILSGAKMTVTFQNHADGSRADMEVNLEGSFFDRSAKMMCNGQPIASIDRKLFNARELFFDQQTYYLSVAPNVDAALMAAICICLDEKKNESK